METITIGVPTPMLKLLHSELELCYGFTLDEIEDELGHLWTYKQTQGLNSEELELAKKCGYGTPEGIRTREFALEIKEYVHLKVTPDCIKSKEQLDRLITDYHINELKLGESYIFLLQYAAVLINRRLNKIGEDGNELSYLKSEYNKYALGVRPDMLQLYIALHEKRKSKRTSVKISVGNNPPIYLENDERWFENMLNDYLDKYLHIESLEEAKNELETLYSDQMGRKSKDPYYNQIIMGTFKLLQENFLQSATGKATVEQCKFICDYLRCVHILKPDDKNNNVNNMQSTINNFLATKTQAYIPKTYKTSPDNNDTKFH